MATVKELLVAKGSDEVISISKNATVLEGAKLMNAHKIGALVVTNDGRVHGIFTERDMLQRVVAEKRDPEKTPVSDVMTSEMACCRQETSIDEARTVMKNKRIRHLPVVGDDMQLHGMISIGDLNAYYANSQEVTIHFLHEYLYGRT